MDINLTQSEMIKLSLIEPNHGQIEGLPKNPRFIKNDKYEKLKKSLEEHPQMLALRELLVYPHGDKYVIIGGNMRYRAMKELKFKTAPCKVISASTSIDDLKAYTIKDNSGFGDWDFDLLANDWDTDDLEDWGIDLPVFEDENQDEQKQAEEDDDETEQDTKEDYFAMMLGDRLYDSNNKYDIPTLRLDEQPMPGVLLPVSAWGADSRQKKGISTYHFYVDDYRFEAIWKDPMKLCISGCQYVVEPNLSLFDTTPIAYGLQQIYKKRWIARYWQECGIKVYADLNVSQKFIEYNRMGIPDGYNAFATRGYDDRFDVLERELQVAREISGQESPNMLVYGGGKRVKEFCQAHGLVYVEQFMQRERR